MKNMYAIICTPGSDEEEKLAEYAKEHSDDLCRIGNIFLFTVDQIDSEAQAIAKTNELLPNISIWTQYALVSIGHDVLPEHKHLLQAATGNWRWFRQMDPAVQQAMDVQRTQRS